MAAPADLWRALAHLQAARRLLRELFALDALIPLNKAIAATERRLARDRPAQGALALELEAPTLEPDHV
jgi:hypothetical protein